jgi:hypothetical protein
MASIINALAKAYALRAARDACDRSRHEHPAILHLQNLVIFRDWTCESCMAQVPAYETHGVEQGCFRPSPTMPIGGK